MAVTLVECGIVVYIVAFFSVAVFFPDVFLIVSISHLWCCLMSQWHPGVNGTSVLLLLLAVCFPHIIVIVCLGQFAVGQFTRFVVPAPVYRLDAA